jgi:hypothetical protein
VPESARDCPKTSARSRSGSPSRRSKAPCKFGGPRHSGRSKPRHLSASTRELTYVVAGRAAELRPDGSSRPARRYSPSSAECTPRSVVLLGADPCRPFPPSRSGPVRPETTPSNPFCLSVSDETRNVRLPVLLDEPIAPPVLPSAEGSADTTRSPCDPKWAR